MTENETPADRLREAAGLVRQGHTRGNLITRRGERCAIGAIGRVQPGQCSTISELLQDEIASAAVDALHDVLPPVEQDGGYVAFKSTRVTVWNDRQARDGEEVAQMMEKAAALYEERVR